MRSSDENVEQQELSVTAGRKAKWHTATLEYGLVCHKAEGGLTIQPRNLAPRNLSNSFENICPYKHLHENVYASFIHNGQKI